MPRADVLPPNLPPRGLNRVEAARYVGVSPGTFDRLVSEGAMPSPKQVLSRKVWDVRALDRAFDELPGTDFDEANPWDEVLPDAQAALRP